LNKKIEEALEKIAKENLYVETLNTRNSDSLDFYDVSVWGIKKSLELAYELGKNKN